MYSMIILRYVLCRLRLLELTVESFFFMKYIVEILSSKLWFDYFINQLFIPIIDQRLLKNQIPA